MASAATSGGTRGSHTCGSSAGCAARSSPRGRFWRAGTRCARAIEHLAGGPLHALAALHRQAALETEHGRGGRGTTASEARSGWRVHGRGTCGVGGPWWARWACWCLRHGSSCGHGVRVAVQVGSASQWRSARERARHGGSAKRPRHCQDPCKASAAHRLAFVRAAEAQPAASTHVWATWARGNGATRVAGGEPCRRWDSRRAPRAARSGARKAGVQSAA